MQPQPQMLLNVEEVAARVNMSPTTIRKLEAQAKFPARHPNCGRSVRWRVADIETYVESGKAG